MKTEATKRDIEHAYWLGVRDAKKGHGATWPVRPFTTEELAAYRKGYRDSMAGGSDEHQTKMA